MVVGIYNAITWLFENASRIGQMLSSLASVLSDIFEGNLDTVASKVEEVLNQAVRGLFDLLAMLLGLGSVKTFTQGLVQRAHDFLSNLINRVLDFVLNILRRIFPEVALQCADWSKHRSWRRPHVVAACTGFLISVVLSSDAEPVSQWLADKRQDVQQWPEGNDNSTLYACCGKRTRNSTQLKPVQSRRPSRLRNLTGNADAFQADNSEATADETRLADTLE